MNRSIKFRVWDKRQSHLIESGKSIGYCNFDIDMSGHLTREILNLFDSDTKKFIDGVNRSTTGSQDNYVIQQFTGIIDKNGKEIYEGDIIVQLIKNPVFSHGAAFAVEFKDNSLREEGIMGWNIDTYQTYEVIGNIYENPELLTK
jgi:uncharacterized phage protein (TIGR01671 family)